MLLVQGSSTLGKPKWEPEHMWKSHLKQGLENEWSEPGKVWRCTFPYRSVHRGNPAQKTSREGQKKDHVGKLHEGNAFY